MSTSSIPSGSSGSSSTPITTSSKPSKVLKTGGKKESRRPYRSNSKGRKSSKRTTTQTTVTHIHPHTVGGFPGVQHSHLTGGFPGVHYPPVVGGGFATTTKTKTVTTSNKKGYGRKGKGKRSSSSKRMGARYGDAGYIGYHHSGHVPDGNNSSSSGRYLRRHEKHHKIPPYPQLEIGSHTKTIVSRIGELMEDLHADQPLVHAFNAALNQTQTEIGSLENKEMPLTAHQILVQSHLDGDLVSIGLRLGDDGNSSQAEPIQQQVGVQYIDEHNLVAKMSLPSDALLTIGNKYGNSSSHQPLVPIGVTISDSDGNQSIEYEETVSISAGRRNDVHAGIHDVAGARMVIPIQLFSVAHQKSYVEHHIPTLMGYLTVESQGHGKPFKLVSFEVGLRMNPSLTHDELPAGYPAITSTLGTPAGQATPLIVLDNADHVDRIHEAIRSQLNELPSGATSISFVSSSPKSTTTENNQEVYWGGMTDIAVSYAVVKLLQQQNLFTRFHDADFLVDLFEQDENGRKLIAEIVRIYHNSYRQHAGHDVEVRGGIQVFPSLAQLLSHTSGLPGFSRIDYEEIYRDYEKMTEVLEKEDVTYFSASAEPLKSFEELEGDFLKKLSEIEHLTSFADTTFGSRDNLTESVIVSMFIRRFTDNQKPEEVVSNILKSLDPAIILRWNKQLLGGTMTEIHHSSPFNLLNAVSSSQYSLQKYVERLVRELANPSCDNPFPVILSSPQKDPLDDISFSRYIAWKSLVFSNHEIVFAESAVTGINSSLLFIIPSANFWGIIVNRASSTSSANTNTPAELLMSVLEALSPTEMLPPIPDSFHVKIAQQLSNCKLAQIVDDVEDPDSTFDLQAILPSPEEVFVMPIRLQTVDDVGEVRVKVDPEHPHTRVLLEFTTSGRTDTVQAIYDPVHAKFSVLDARGVLLTEEIFISSEYVAYGALVYLPKNKLSGYQKNLQKAYDRLVRDARESMAESKASQILSHVEPILKSTSILYQPSSSSSIQSSIFSSSSSSQTPIGRGFGVGLGTGLLGGAALGLAAGSLVRPYYPYGYGYGYGYPYYGGYPVQYYGGIPYYWYGGGWHSHRGHGGRHFGGGHGGRHGGRR